MLIALDFDDTYTKDPYLWDDFINNAKNRGHKVICVTMRFEEEGKEVIESIGRRCNIIFTERQSKEKFLKKMGIKPDIWIDDSPFWIYKDA